MESSTVFIVISILALALIVIILFTIQQQTRRNKLTPLAGLAFAFVLAGIIFSEEKIVGYGLIGVGVILSIIDIIKNTKKDTANH
jgi:uncharacterized membrane protein